MNVRPNSKALIVYATRYGATKGTSYEIAEVLKEHNLEVKVVNVKRKKSKTSQNMI